MTTTHPHLRARGARAALLLATLPLLVAGCGSSESSEAPDAPDPARSSGATDGAASPSATGSEQATGDLCAALPRDEIDPVFCAYGLEVDTLEAGTSDEGPTCTITGTDPGHTVTVTRSEQAFADLAAQLGPADAPPEDNSAYLPALDAFGSELGEGTLLVRDSAGGGSLTPTMIFVLGTALDGLS